MTEDFEDKTILADDLQDNSKDQNESTAKQKLIKSKLVCLDDSSLTDEQKGLVIELDKDDMTFGRSDDNDFSIKSHGVSRKHARIFLMQDKLCIEDLKSANGVFVNNKKITNSVILHGDTINLGSIPFRYEIERPEAENKDQAAVDQPEEDEDEKTMLFGDAGASDAILEAKEKEEKKPEPQKPKKKVESKTQRVSSHLQENIPVKEEKKSKSPLRLILSIIILFVLVFGSFLYYQKVYLVNKNRNMLIKRNFKMIQEFSEFSEKYPHRFDESISVKDIRVLNNILNEVKQGYLTYPNDTKIYALEATLMFMILERQVNSLIEKNHPEDAVELIKKAKVKIYKFYIKTVKEKSESARNIAEVVDLIKLLEIVVDYKIFQHKYPDPDAKNVKYTQSMKDSIIKLNNDLKDEFISLKKKNHTALMVKYLYFGGMVKEVEEHCFTLVYKWSRQVFTKR